MIDRKISYVFYNGKVYKQLAYPEITCASFEGAGARGIAYQIIRVLEQVRFFNDLKYLAGSSAGAIAAYILALGYSLDDAINKMSAVKFEDFLEGAKPYPTTPEVLSTVAKGFKVIFDKNHSLSSGERFLTWLEDLAQDSPIKKRKLTYRDLYEKIIDDEKKSIKSPFRELFVIATRVDVKCKYSELFSFGTTPDAEIPTTVLASAAFPLVFKPVVVKKHPTDKGALYSDGGLIKNSPHSVFRNQKFWPKGYKHDEQQNPGCVIFKVDTRDEILQLYDIHESNPINSITDRLIAYYDAQTSNTDYKELQHSLVIAIDDCGIETLDLKLEHQKKELLIKNSEKIGQEFLENYYLLAYDVICLGTPQEFLTSLNLEELTVLKDVYEKMLTEKAKDFEHHNDNNKLPSFKILDPDNPTIDELKNMIESLNQLIKRPSESFIPEFFINIKPKKSINDWGYLTKKQMKEELKLVSNCLKHEEQDFNNFFETNFKKNKIEYGINLKTLVAKHERLKKTKDRKEELKFKLGITSKKPSCDDKNKNHSNELLSYSFFCEYVKNIKESSDDDLLIKAIFSEVDIYRHNKIEFTSKENPSHCFSFDLYDEGDRQLFLITTSLFLTLKDTKKAENFNNRFKLNCFSSEEIINEFLALSPIDLASARYHIEELLNFFERKYAHDSKDPITFDQIFKKAKKINKETDIELQDLNTKILGNRSISSYLAYQNSLFYHRSLSSDANLNASNENDNDNNNNRNLTRLKSNHN